MKAAKQDKEYLLNFLMQGNSLHDLLGILSNICENLDLTYLNPRIKHFRYFQFTFFGLMVKAKGLLEMMVFRAEFLKDNISGFDETYPQLVRLKKSMGLAYNLINEKRMVKGKNKIIEVNKEYQQIFDDMLNMHLKMI